MGKACGAYVGRERHILYRFWVGKPDIRKPLGRPRHRWDDSIKIDLQELRCCGMNWTEMAQDRDS
jgi:hypothetical protein